MMKYRFSFIVLACMTVLLLCGCAEASKAKLHAAVEEFNKRCPVMADQFSTIEKVEYEGDVVTLYVLVDSKFSDIDALRENKELVKGNILASYRRGDANVKTFLESVTDAEADLKAVYRNEADNSLSITITCDELREAMNSKGGPSLEDMDRMIQTTNLSLPVKLNEFITLTAMIKEGNCVYYTYDVVGPICDKISQNIEGAKAETLVNLKNLGPTDKNQMRPIYTAGMSLGYRYHNVDDDTNVEFVYTNSELSEVFE